MSELSYPIGKFQEVLQPSDKQLEEWLVEIEDLPGDLRYAVSGLTDTQLDTPYREGGWTVCQVVHHVADSHMHSYARFRFALTDPGSVIKPYDEAAWAELPDARSAPVLLSLSLLDALHARWVMLLRSLDEAALAKAFVHPEMGPVKLSKAIQLYAWHGRHHEAHITGLRERNGW